MSHRRGTLSFEEQDFFFDVIFPGLDERRDDLDRDLFALLAKRLLEEGYTADTLRAIVNAANYSVGKN